MASVRRFHAVGSMASMQTVGPAFGGDISDIDADDGEMFWNKPGVR